MKKPHEYVNCCQKPVFVFAALLPCIFLLAPPTFAQEIRCPDWEYLVAKHEGRAALRAAAPSASFDDLIGRAAVKQASATASKTPLAANTRARATQTTQCRSHGFKCRDEEAW